MIRVLLAIVLLGPIATSAWAQSSMVQQRRDDLAKVQELINDPDPLMRVAHMEEIVREGDAMKLQIAIRVALTGNNDQMTRGLAFRAYLAGVQRFILDMSMEPTLQKRFEQAQQQGPQQLNELRNAIPYLRELISSGFRADTIVKEFDMKSGRGKIAFGYQGGLPAEFQVNGDRLIATTTGFMGYGIACTNELRPTRELSIEGVMICQTAGFGRIRLVAPMF